MKTFKALSLTQHVKEWLANTRQPRILHVFDEACNLVNEHQDVLSIVAWQVGEGPFNLVVENDFSFSDKLSVECQVALRDNQLNLNDLIIDTSNTRLWNPCPDWGNLYGRRNDILHQATLLSIANYIPSLPDHLLGALTSSIVTADIPFSLVAVKNLAGLGQGLTPAGDDFILGALYATWIIHPLKVASVLANEIAEIAVPLTTSLSAAWIKSAGRAEAGILWHELFDALLYGKDLELPITKILSVGETSGADALAGFMGVMSAFNERIIDECPS